MLKAVNVLLGLSFVVQLVTVVAMEIFHKDSFEKVHTLNGALFFALVFVHLFLNFGWIKKNILNIK